MTTKSNWQTVHDQMIAEERRRLGDPPSSEEALAYMKGELNEQDEARVRALLLAYPELARTLTHPFPAEGEGEVFSEAELSRNLAELQGRVEPRGAQVLPFRALSAALAAVAMVTLVLGAMLWETRREMTQSRLLPEAQELLPDGRRGGGDFAETVAAADEPFQLKISIADQPEFPAYRVEIADEATRRNVETIGPAVRNDSSNFIVDVRRGLPAGRYSLVLYGMDADKRQQNLATYAFRVAAR